MTDLFRLVEVKCDDTDRAYSFTLSCGDQRIFQVASSAEKETMIDAVTGATNASVGQVQIVQGERRFSKKKESWAAGERRIKNGAAPVIWESLSKARQGRVAWVAANGGLISNLKVWENVTLPLWHHFRQDVPEAERRVKKWLDLLGMEQSAYADFMAAPPASIEVWQRKLAGLLRALVQMPQLIVLDAQLFEGVEAQLVTCWIAALDTYAEQKGAVLAIADRPTLLPWQKIE